MSDVFNSMVVQALLGICIILLLGGIGWLKFKRDAQLVDQILKKTQAKARKSRLRSTRFPATKDLDRGLKKKDNAKEKV